MRNFIRQSMVLAIVLALVACGQDNSANTQPSPTAPAASPMVATPVPTMLVSEITWSDSTDAVTGAPGASVQMFEPLSPLIVAAIGVNNVPKGTEFVATWTINGQPIPGAEMHVVINGDLPQGWLNFTFTRKVEERYPLGALGVTVTSSTGVLRESGIRIGFP